eukprot:NODE_6378_length_1677_cov_4.165806.p1 GENE.NODE_6378_length_1677_cov_4.165806~~NODE_6378_length_1677_cov_4.165806.p1  ORF type:complete len:298 (-),score=43.89 NODE_6378_length_1677_cov_4.165806:405-1298(-)
MAIAYQSGRPEFVSGGGSSKGGKNLNISTLCRWFGGLHLAGQHLHQALPKSKIQCSCEAYVEDFNTLCLSALLDEELNLLCFVLFNVLPTVLMFGLKCKFYDELYKLLCQEGGRISSAQPQRLQSVAWDLKHLAQVPLQFGSPAISLSSNQRQLVQHMGIGAEASPPTSHACRWCQLRPHLRDARCTFGVASERVAAGRGNVAADEGACPQGCGKSTRKRQAPTRQELADLRIRAAKKQRNLFSLKVPVDGADNVHEQTAAATSSLVAAPLAMVASPPLPRLDDRVLVIEVRCASRG